ncbi:MAG: glycosyl hydrolase [Eubacteriales bacterium]
MINPQEFKNPSAQYRIKPFWFWNSRLDGDELLRQVRDMHEKGIGGFFIHARFGLETEYMSQAWFDAIRLCIAEAAKLGMEVWLYDENPFPSGIADLKVSSLKEYRNRFMECRECTLSPGVNTLTVGEGEVPAVCNAKDGLLLQAECADGRLTVTNPSDEDITAAVYIMRIIDNPNGKIFGINYMNPEAVRRFIELTHAQYALHLGEFFGTVIKGIFMDEPTLLPWHQDLNWYTARDDGRVLAWDEKIFGIMKTESGREPGEILTALFYGTGDGDGGIRRHFWQTLSTLYEENFFKIYSLWCREHELLLTGHVLLEEGLYFNHLFQGNIMKDLEYLDMPGTDQLCSFAEQPSMEYMVGGAKHLPKMKTNIQGPKTVSSAAHLLGKKRVISESFGIGGWQLNPQDMKRIVDWEYALGINQLCVHAFFYSIEGFRKYDAPPCHMHNSFWPHYRLFADYVARLSYVLSSGSHAARVAVLYPLNAFRSSYLAGLQREEDKRISDVFDMLCAMLMKLHYDYDIVGEHHLERCVIKDGSMHIADESYSALLIPSLKGLPEAAAGRIAEFTASGGRILVFNEDETAAGKLNLDLEEDTAIFTDMLDGFLAGSGAADVTVSGDGNRDIYYLHRTMEDEEVYFFTNTSGRMLHADISVGAAGDAAVYDAEDGTVSALEGCEEHNGRNGFRHSFDPYSSLLVGFGKKSGILPAKPGIDFSGMNVKVLDSSWRFNIESYNVFPLENWNFNVRVFTFGSEFNYTNEFYISKKIGSLKLMLDDIEYRNAFMGLADVTVLINGQTVPISGESYIDKKFKLADLTDLAVTGRNTVEIVFKHSPWSGEPHLLTSPVKLLGDFTVQEKDGKPVIGAACHSVKTGSWTAQGYPYYSGTGVYSGELIFETCPAAAVLDLTEAADCAEVYVNGKHAGIRLWNPRAADITEFVTEGVNHIVIKVTNSMVNFIQNEPRPSGLLGDVKVYFK